MTVYIHQLSLVNALGSRPGEILSNWSAGRAPGLEVSTAWLTDGSPVRVGTVDDASLPAIPAAFRPHHDSRNNRLLMKLIEDDREAWDAHLSKVDPTRVAVVLGTSTSGSEEVSRFVKARIDGADDGGFSGWSQEMGDPSRFLAAYLGFRGPAYTVCTACTSSSRAVMTAVRLIEAGIVDAAVAGGADTLSPMPVNGFNALGVLSKTGARPLSEGRDGITIGEAAGLVWLSREPSDVAVLGMGESSDGYHMSSPDPEGAGAEKAVAGALAEAGLEPGAIDYVNLHGTATPLNDSAECRAVSSVLGSSTVAGSTKNLTGHTLGAAGITDLGLCVLLLRHEGPFMLPPQFAPGDVPDPALAPLSLALGPTPVEARTAMSTNFAFGGNNTALIIGVTK